MENENAAVAVFKALGDESRLAILRILLAEEESYVELLASRLGLTSATVSFHLKKLEAAGLVSCRRTQFYRIYSVERALFAQSLEALIGKTPAPDDDTKYRKAVIAAFFENGSSSGRLKALPTQRKKREVVLVPSTERGGMPGRLKSRQPSTTLSSFSSMRCPQAMMSFVRCCPSPSMVMTPRSAGSFSRT